VIINIAAIKIFERRTIAFSKRGEIVSIVTGALIGLVSPLPTYTAVPIGVSLMLAGAPYSAVIAFCIASPLMNPTIFFLTATQMGMQMAAARTISSFLIAVAAGLLSIPLNRVLKPKENSPVTVQRKQRTFVQLVLSNSRYLLKTFSIAILLSSIVKSLVDPQLFQRVLGGGTSVGILVAMALGVPFYTCGGAAIPFVQTLGELGMSKGAMLAFFLAGPATKLETLYVYQTYLGKKTLFFYLFVSALFSFIFGFIYSLLT
jgi:uncharacterized membrane protein YraQ (UPF0718 family)